MVYRAGMYLEKEPTLLENLLLAAKDDLVNSLETVNVLSTQVGDVIVGKICDVLLPSLFDLLGTEHT